MSDANPHLALPPVHAGAPLAGAPVAALLVHGRGQSPDYLLEHLVARLDAPAVAYVLPAAAGNSWYDARFWAPPEELEPQRTQALEAIRGALDGIAAAGVPAERTVVVGFSQGGCLVADLVWEDPRPYGGAAILTGALTGPRERERTQPEGLDGLPLVIGTAREDEWVALADVERTAAAFEAAGAAVALRTYDEPEHAIYDPDVDRIRDLLARVAAG